MHDISWTDTSNDLEFGYVGRQLAGAAKSRQGDRMFILRFWTVSSPPQIRNNSITVLKISKNFSFKLRVIETFFEVFSRQFVRTVSLATLVCVQQYGLIWRYLWCLILLSKEDALHFFCWMFFLSHKHYGSSKIGLRWTDYVVKRSLQAIWTDPRGPGTRWRQKATKTWHRICLIWHHVTSGYFLNSK